MGKSMASRRRRHRRPMGAVRLVGRIHGGAVLSARAKARLDLVDWHRAHGANVSRTARHFGYSRPTVYRWLARYDRFRLESLEDRSSAPRRRRRPTWTVEQVEAVRRLRERYPRWGKDKLVVLLRREGLLLSTSMVGRILAYLVRRAVLREPARRRISVRKRLWRRPHAVRLPVDWPIERPGDLVELDTLDVRPPGVTHPFKQFTARDRVSRWDAVELRRNARARTAAEVLDALTARMPFPVRAISVDNGSEFMAEFEAACAARTIRLLVLPPRSPKLHGSVERANRTHTEEFYEVTDAPAELDALAAELSAWEVVYNTIRPHQALGYLTPAEFLASLEAKV
jgi:putative transposase